MDSRSAVKLVVGAASFAQYWLYFAGLHHGAHYTCADPGLLHNCSVCGSGSVFLCKGDSSFFFHRCRFALWGSVSTAAFNVNLIFSAGSDCTAFDHRLAPSGLAVLIICPFFSRLFSSVSLLSSSAYWVALLAADANDFLFQFGSSARASLTPQVL